MITPYDNKESHSCNNITQQDARLIVLMAFDFSQTKGPSYIMHILFLEVMNSLKLHHVYRLESSPLLCLAAALVQFVIVDVYLTRGGVTPCHDHNEHRKHWQQYGHFRMHEL